MDIGIRFTQRPGAEARVLAATQSMKFDCKWSVDNYIMSARDDYRLNID